MQAAAKNPSTPSVSVHCCTLCAGAMVLPVMSGIACEKLSAGCLSLAACFPPVMVPTSLLSCLPCLQKSGPSLIPVQDEESSRLLDTSKGSSNGSAPSGSRG
jgi:hypothetical protein